MCVPTYAASLIHSLLSVGLRSFVIYYHNLQSVCRKLIYKLDIRGSVHHSTIHKEKSNNVQQCIKILLFHNYVKLNMFRATHRLTSGA
jgi:hypothetical protein